MKKQILIIVSLLSSALHAMENKSVIVNTNVYSRQSPKGLRGIEYSVMDWQKLRTASTDQFQQFLAQNPTAVKAVTNDNGRTLLHLAARAGEVEMVRSLIAAKADVNEVEHSSGFTPLTVALICLSPKCLPKNRGVNNQKVINIVDILVGAGAQPCRSFQYNVDQIMLDYDYYNFCHVENTLYAIFKKYNVQL